MNRSKEVAILAAQSFLRWFPYRYAGIAEIQPGVWTCVSGKTKARFNNLARKGLNVFLINN